MKEKKTADRGIEVLMYAKREDIFKMQNGRHMSKSRSGKDLLQKNNYNKGTQTKVVTKV